MHHVCSSGLICEHLRPGERALAAVYPLHAGSWQRVHAPANGATCRPASLWRCLSKRGDFAACNWCFYRCGEVSLFCGEHALIRIPEARVSRSIGKFDTTACGRKRQVAFWVTSVAQVGQRLKSPRNAKAPLPRGVAPRHLQLITGLSNKPGGFVPAVVCSYPAECPLKDLFLKKSLTGSCVLKAAQISYLAACHITGTL